MTSPEDATEVQKIQPGDLGDHNVSANSLSRKDNVHTPENVSNMRKTTADDKQNDTDEAKACKITDNEGNSEDPNTALGDPVQQKYIIASENASEGYDSTIIFEFIPSPDISEKEYRSEVFAVSLKMPQVDESVSRYKEEPTVDTHSVASFKASDSADIPVSDSNRVPERDVSKPEEKTLIRGPTENQLQDNRYYSLQNESPLHLQEKLEQVERAHIDSGINSTDFGSEPSSPRAEEMSEVSQIDMYPEVINRNTLMPIVLRPEPSALRGRSDMIPRMQTIHDGSPAPDGLASNYRTYEMIHESELGYGRSAVGPRVQYLNTSDVVPRHQFRHNRSGRINSSIRSSGTVTHTGLRSSPLAVEITEIDDRTGVAYGRVLNGFVTNNRVGPEPLLNGRPTTLRSLQYNDSFGRPFSLSGSHDAEWVPSQELPYGVIGPTPTLTKCHACRSIINTEIKRQPSSCAVLSGTLLLMMGCVLGCCLIPCYLSSCQTVDHYCPKCKTFLGRFSRY